MSVCSLLKLKISLEISLWNWIYLLLHKGHENFNSFHQLEYFHLNLLQNIGSIGLVVYISFHIQLHVLSIYWFSGYVSFWNWDFIISFLYVRMSIFEYTLMFEILYGLRIILFYSIQEILLFWWNNTTTFIL